MSMHFLLHLPSQQLINNGQNQQFGKYKLQQITNQAVSISKQQNLKAMQPVPAIAETKEINLNSNVDVLQNLSQLVRKSKILINLESNSEIKGQMLSIGQTNCELIKNIFKAFKIIRKEGFNLADAGDRLKVTQHLNQCDKLIKLFQIKLIDSVELIMKKTTKTADNAQENGLQNIYQQFYISCSSFMNSSYDHSNKLCMVLSEQAQTLTRVISGTLPTYSSELANTSQQTDLNFLKILLQRVSNIKKTYQSEILIREHEVAKYQTQINQYKNQIVNLVNQRDQLTQDISELQQFIQNGSINQAKQLISYRNQSKNKQQKKTKFIELRKSMQMKKNGQMDQLSMRIKQLQQLNQSLSSENTQLKKKLQQYKTQIHRSAWIMSVQNRQLSLNQQKVQQLTKRIQVQERQASRQSQPANEYFQNMSVFSSDISFNPNSTMGAKRKLVGQHKYERNQLNVFANNQNVNNSMVWKQKGSQVVEINPNSFESVFSKVKTPSKFGFRSSLGV